MYEFKVNEKHIILIEKGIKVLQDLNVPVSDDVLFVYCHGLSRYGYCIKDKEHSFKIGINEDIADDLKITNTAIHELLHTIDNDGYTSHGGNWKKWANYVSTNSQYKITVSDNDSKILYKSKKNIEFVVCICPLCGFKAYIDIKSIHNNDSTYTCKKCNKHLYSVLPESPIKNLSSIERNKYIGRLLKTEPTLNEVLNCLVYSDKEDTRSLIRYCLTHFGLNGNLDFKLSHYVDSKLKEELAFECINGQWDEYIKSEKERITFEAFFSRSKYWLQVVNRNDEVFGKLGHFKNHIEGKNLI